MRALFPLLLVLLASASAPASASPQGALPPRSPISLPRGPPPPPPSYRGLGLPTAPIVTVANGPVQGVEVDGAYAYLGIPFAAPPVGENRFRPPQPVAANWTEPLRADAYGASCPQFYVDLLGLQWHLGQEDCLTINVARPANVSFDEVLPVYVWIYGGGFALGSSSEFGNYPLAPLSKHGVVMVSMNYRVGALGFLGHEALFKESGTTGNYGTLDQTAALEWVSRNIHAFGGDPKRVTIGGESAGAFSVAWHLASPSSAGLFHAAVMESGSADSRTLFQSYENATTLGRNYGDDIGCPSTYSGVDWLECMRGKSVNEIMNSNFTNTRLGGVPPEFFGPGKWVPRFAPVFTFGPVVDGAALPGLPLTLMREGKFSKVPLLIGTNKNECTLFVNFLYFVMSGISFPLTPSSSLKALTHFFNATAAAQALELYPESNYPGGEFYRMADAMTDFTFACGTRRIMRAMNAADVPVYGYTFTYKGDFLVSPFMGDYHSSELPFVFDHSSLLTPFSARDQAMSDIFGAYWTNFMISQSPNSPQAVPLTWQQYGKASNESQITLKLPPGEEFGYRDSYCDFWDTVTMRQQ